MCRYRLNVSRVSNIATTSSMKSWTTARCWAAVSACTKRDSFTTGFRSPSSEEQGGFGCLCRARLWSHVFSFRLVTAAYHRRSQPKPIQSAVRGGGLLGADQWASLQARRGRRPGVVCAHHERSDVGRAPAVHCCLPASPWPAFWIERPRIQGLRNIRRNKSSSRVSNMVAMEEPAPNALAL